MKFAKQQIEAERKKPTAALMSYKVPSVSQAAHQYFLNNAEKIKGIIPENLNLDPGAAFKALNPLLIVAGLAAAAVIIAQVAPLIPKSRKAE